MRRAVAGVTVALLLIAALIVFAVNRLGTLKQSVPENAADPARIAAQIPEGFEGNRQIADWRLSCEPAQRTPMARGARSGKKRASPEWKIPRCRVFAVLAGGSSGDIRITFRRAGINRALSLFVRLSSSDVSENDKISLRADKSAHVMVVRRCAQDFCLVREPMTKADFSSLLPAKTMSLAFASRASGKHFVIGVSTIGLTDAIRAVLRIDR